MYNEKFYLTTQDILDKEFKIDARGYRPQEVDKFLDMVMRDYSEFMNIIKKLEKENRILTEENHKIKSEYRKLREITYKDVLDDIYTGMIAISIGVCKNKSEIVQAILIATIAFYIGEKRALKNFVSGKNTDSKNIEVYILDEIYKIDIDKIKSYGDIYYCFKRG